MKKLLIAIAFVCLITSCKKDCNNADEKSYFLFGHYYGMCVGANCVNIYKLEKNNLFEDTKDKYPPSESGLYNGNYIQLSTQKYELAKEIISQIPADLKNETASVIGQPDAGDWGGFYIEFMKDGKRKYILLDKMKTNVPTKYHAFIDKLNDTLLSLK